MLTIELVNGGECWRFEILLIVIIILHSFVAKSASFKHANTYVAMLATQRIRIQGCVSFLVSMCGVYAVFCSETEFHIDKILESH